MRLLYLRASFSQTFTSSPTLIEENLPHFPLLKFNTNVSYVPRIPNSNSSLQHSIKIHTKERSILHNKVGRNWMEYQGINNWEGLLDPLDDNLRSEIIRYGRFVEASYKAFDCDPSSPTYGSCKFSKDDLLQCSGIDEIGYKVTKNLCATSCGPSWMTMQSNWIGYVAVCDDKDEIARLGRRDVVISFRGTMANLEWLQNIHATLASLPEDMAHDSAKVMNGFLRLYTSHSTSCPSLQDMIREEIARILQLYGDEPLSFTITGHSLGAALATLTAYDINVNFPNAPMVTVISFGGPRVGNKQFKCQLEEYGTKVLRIVNPADFITRVPGFRPVDDGIDDDVTSTSVFFPNWFQRQLGYADVGTELRLTSEKSLSLINKNAITNHDLSTYLQLVDGLVRSSYSYKKSLLKEKRKKSHGHRLNWLHA